MQVRENRFFHSSQSSPADQSEKEGIHDDSPKYSIESAFLVPSFQLSGDSNISEICDRVETDGKHLVLSDQMKVNTLSYDFVARKPFICSIFIETFLLLFDYHVLCILNGLCTELG